MKMRIVLSAISILFVHNITEAKDIKSNKRNFILIDKIESDLKKINASIDVTKNKIKQQKEIQYSADLYYMLAELFHDKATLLISLKREKSPGAPIEELDFVMEKRLYQDAIDNYKIIEDRYPDYAALDRALYTMAQEYKILNLEKDALAYFKKITEKFPESKYSVKSYIEIGDIFFVKKDYAYAKTQFEKALVKAQEPELSQAHYKIGWCLVHSESWLKSLKSFEKVFLADESVAAHSAKDDLREEALVASVWPFSELPPLQVSSQIEYQRPLEYYRKMAGDKVRYRAVLLRLAQRLELKKRYAQAADAAFELFRLSSDLREKKTAFELAYTVSKKANVKRFPTWFISELRDLLFLMHRQVDDKQMQADVKKYEVVFRHLVTTMNKTAMTANREDDFKMVVNGYEDYLTIYPRTKYSSLMKLNQAEARFNSKEYALSGQTYLDLVKGAKVKKATKKKELLESSLDAFLKGMLSSSDETLERFQSRDGYREVADLYANQFPNEKKVPTIRFNVAKTYYDEQNFDVAAQKFFNFIQAHPDSDKTKEASLLYLDCFYLRQQLKEMAEAGKKLLKIKNLPKQIQIEISKSARQAQLKSMRSMAGDFYSKQYAKTFKDFASKNRNTKLGEQALYEAFISLKSQDQMQAFEVGEEYISVYGNKDRAHEIHLTLIQMSLLFLDYKKAAAYMGSFAEKYPQERDSRSLANQAAQIYEFNGDLDEAVVAYQLAGEPTAGLRALFRYGAWQKLSKASASVSGLPGRYYQGVSIFRLGNTAAAYPLLQQVAESSSSSLEEKEMVAHASVILAEIGLNEFRRRRPGEQFSAELIQEKANQFQTTYSLLQNGINSGGGRWVIGSLYNLARLNKYFVNFLNSISPPAGMSKAKLQEVVRPQVQGYENAANENFALCVKLAEENEIPSAYVNGCRNRAEVLEANEIIRWSETERSPTSVPRELRQNLKKDPRSSELLIKLAELEIRSGKPKNALMVLSRSLEVDPSNSTNDTYMGIAYLHLREYVSAQAAFQQAIQKNPNDGLANRGLAGIAKAFGFNAKAQAYRSKSRAGAGVNLHPWLK